MDKGNMGRKTKKGIFNYSGKDRSVTTEFLDVQKQVNFQFYKLFINKTNFDKNRLDKIVGEK